MHHTNRILNIENSYELTDGLKSCDDLLGYIGSIYLALKNLIKHDRYLYEYMLKSNK